MDFIIGVVIAIVGIGITIVIAYVQRVTNSLDRTIQSINNSINSASIELKNAIEKSIEKMLHSNDEIIGAKNEVLIAKSDLTNVISDIGNVLKLTKANSDRIGDIKNLIDTTTMRIEDNSTHSFLANNRWLQDKVSFKMSEKKSAGHYICRYVSITNPEEKPCLAVDCGTSPAWAFWEIVRLHSDRLRVVTNNIFVPLIFPNIYYNQENSAVPRNIESECHAFEGQYYPSHGGIFKLGSTSDSYIDQLRIYKPGYILLGCNSFTCTDGPCSVDDENIKFKKALVDYALDNDSVHLFILLDIDKFGVKHDSKGNRINGTPISTASWCGLRERYNVHIVTGFDLKTSTHSGVYDGIYDGVYNAFTDSIGQYAESIESEVMAMKAAGREKNQVKAIMTSGAEIDLYFWAERKAQKNLTTNTSSRKDSKFRCI